MEKRETFRQVEPGFKATVSPSTYTGLVSTDGRPPRRHLTSDFLVNVFVMTGVYLLKDLTDHCRNLFVPFRRGVETMCCLYPSNKYTCTIRNILVHDDRERCTFVNFTFLREFDLPKSLSMLKKIYS